MDRFAVAGDQYLKNRNGIFYVEMRVPSHLVNEIGKTHFRESLKTSNLTEAKRLRNVRLSEIERLIREAEQRIAVRKGDRTRIENMSEGQLELVVSDWVGKELKSAQQSYELYLSNSIPDDTDFPGPTQILKEYKEHLALLEATPSPMRDEQIARMALKCAADQQLSLSYRQNGVLKLSVAEIDADEKSKAYRNFRELVRKAWCESLRFQMALWNGERHEPEYEEVIPLAEGNRRKSKITLERLIELHEADPKKTDKLPKLQMRYDYVFRLLREVVGEAKDIKAIDRADCREVRDLLMTLPANATKKFPGKTFRQISVACSSMPAKDKPPALSQTTQNSYLACISTLFQFAVNETYMTVNPAKALIVSSSKHSREDRSTFTEGQLERIFRSNLFAVDTNHSRTSKFPELPSTEASRYWVSIIALYHGMRANEICQLKPIDVVNRNGAIHFNLTNEGDGQRLKTGSSKREVPFHPVLLQLGFDKYVEAIKRSGVKQLFPDFNLDSTGYYSRKISRWFNEQLLAELGIKEKGLTFHSLRHSFKDAARRAGIREQYSMAICGHDEGTTASKYGDGFRAQDLAPEIAKIIYPSVSLKRVITAK
jgi:integrase